MRVMASPSAGPRRACHFGVGVLLASARFTSTSMTPRLGVHADRSAVLAGFASALEDAASSTMNTPGYAMNSLKEARPFDHRVISRKTLSETSRMISADEVDRRLALPSHPGARLRQALAESLHREVDDARRPPERAAMVPVSKSSEAMSRRKGAPCALHVDAAGDHVLPCRVDLFARRLQSLPTCATFSPR